MQELLNKLYPYNATLLGEEYDARLEILKQELPLEVIEIPSGTKFSTWTVPNEWKIKDAWVKFKGKKILNYKKDPMCVASYSVPFHGKLQKEELQRHIFKSENGTGVPYAYLFYQGEWGFGYNGELEDGEYEVFIDSEFVPGVMKIGVHTIPGKIDKEILLFAHLDHPYQANDNLSGVVCLVDLAKRIKSDHTIKIIFCPETIGSIAYAHTQDLSKVVFALAVDSCGNEHKDGMLLVKAFDKEARINRIAHCAFQTFTKRYRKTSFRGTIGSDETVFNDPDINIPSILLTTHPYEEYHTSLDTPEIINFDVIKEVGDVVLKIIEIADKDYVPFKLFKGPLFRSKYGMQSPAKIINLNYDYFFYDINGKKYLTELCAEYEINFDTMYEYMEKIISDGFIKKCP